MITKPTTAELAAVARGNNDGVSASGLDQAEANLLGPPGQAHQQHALVIHEGWLLALEQVAGELETPAHAEHARQKTAR